MANITVSVPDDVYHAARVRAAEDRTTVSALVREYLVRLTSERAEFLRLLALQEATLDQIHARGSKFSAADRLTRDEVHDRDALR